MSTQLTWLGHATWLLETGGVKVLLDPFLANSPAATVKPADLTVDFILISHGHFDHVEDAAEIANRCGATLLANYEIAPWFANKHGVKQTIGINLGGSISFPFGKVKLTPAWHSSSLPDGTYGGSPAGFLITLAENQQKIYFACDTALFSDMRLIGSVGLDLAVLPIGDIYTMGPDDAVEATKLLNPKFVAPTHYNTWPPIAQDAQAWANQIQQQTSAQPLVPVVGVPFTL